MDWEKFKEKIKNKNNIGAKELMYLPFYNPILIFTYIAVTGDRMLAVTSNESIRQSFNGLALNVETVSNITNMNALMKESFDFIYVAGEKYANFTGKFVLDATSIIDSILNNDLKSPFDMGFDMIYVKNDEADNVMVAVTNKPKYWRLLKERRQITNREWLQDFDDEGFAEAVNKVHCKYAQSKGLNALIQWLSEDFKGEI